MKVLSIGTDRNVFKAGEARERQIEYGHLFDELHIIVFSKKKLHLKPEKISDNTWIYPTNSLSKFTYVYDAKKIGESILGKDKKSDWTITSQDPFETGLVASHLSSISGARLNIQIHTNFLDPYFKKFSPLNRLRIPQAKRFLENANSVRVVSEQIKNSISNLNSKISFLPMFVDINKISQANPSFNLHEKYPEFDFVILSVARLEFEKNFPFALKVFSEILKDFPKAGFVIVGDGREKNKLQKLVKKLKLEKSVKFEGLQTDTISYYKTADLYLNTSFFEGYSRSLIEAAASSCPILSTNVGPVSEVLLPEKDVLVCGVNDEECFIEKIKSVIQNPEIKTAIINSASGALTRVARSKEDYLSDYKKAILGQ